MQQKSKFTKPLKFTLMAFKLNHFSVMVFKYSVVVTFQIIFNLIIASIQTKPHYFPIKQTNKAPVVLHIKQRGVTFRPPSWPCYAQRQLA